MRKSACLLVALSMVACVCLTGCAAEESVETTATEGSAPTLVIDIAGRSVEVPDDVERVVALGPGALRLAVYAGGADVVVGIEEIESRPPVARPYILANEELLDLPVIGAGGPDSAPDAERILSVQPDVIFVAQIADASAADELQAKTGIPVFVLSYGDTGSFGEELFDSIEIVGTVLGTTERAAEVSAYLSETLDDLSARTQDVESDPSVFVGALGYKGLHGLESTQADYPPFSAIGARNVASDLGKGSVMIDKEKLVEWDPDYVFVDRSGLSLVFEDVAASRPLYESMTAVTGAQVYAQLPFNNYWTNIEIALADAYYVGTVLYPEQFADVDPAAKADELATFLDGAPVYDTLTQIYGGGFSSLDLLAD